MMTENQWIDACDQVAEAFAAGEMIREQAVIQLVRLGLDHSEASDFLDNAIA